jgi:SpoVK/Ycf46/Vps4 family AAA+-type ATPase
VTATSVLASTPFDSPLDHIELELRWTALRLAIIVERSRRKRSVGPPAEYRGLYVTDEEVDVLLAGALEDASGVEQLLARANELRLEIDQRSAASRAAGRQTPLQQVAADFGLSEAEQRVLVLALAPNIEPAYEKIYAYTNDDITRRWPTVGLALEVLSDDRDAALGLRHLFYQDSNLCRNQLLIVSETGTPRPPLLSRQTVIHSHVSEFLLGQRVLDPALRRVAQLVAPQGTPSPEAEALSRVLRERSRALIYLGGRWQAEKEAAAAHAAASSGLGLVAVNGPALRSSPDAELVGACLLRDARLLGAALLFEGWLDGEADASGNSLLSALESHPLPVFFSDRPAAAVKPPIELDLQVEFAAPPFDDRREAWAATAGAASEDASHLAATYRFGARQIAASARMAAAIADHDGRDAISMRDIKAAAQAQSQPQLSSLAQKIVPRFNWEDIILPGDRLAQLHEIANYVLYQHVVYEQWRVGGNSSLGRGVAALFAGQSGTGKTMAAEIIANDLGLELYKIDLAGLVSKYIGETEKNLAKIFEEASDTNAILFFDEADAVFGKRTEVKDSHDRYANIEVSYLLQKIEEYDGIVVLATNLRANLDEAFLRRMRAIVEFPFPEVDDRLRIWAHMMRTGAPMEGDIDLEFMAKQFRIAGGNIRNVVLFAAFLAASEGKSIGMSHLIQGTKREYQKLGRLVTESDFGRWYEQVRA